MSDVVNSSRHEGSRRLFRRRSYIERIMYTTEMSKQVTKSHVRM
jgi:hypothetical protein